MYSANVVYAQNYNQFSYALPSGSTTPLLGGSGSVASRVLSVPAGCVASGLNVDVFNINTGATGATGSTGTISLATGTFAQVLAGSLTTSALACTITVSGATATCSNTASTVTLTANQFISLQFAFNANSAQAFNSSDFLVSFVCK